MWRDEAARASGADPGDDSIAEEPGADTSRQRGGSATSASSVGAKASEFPSPGGSAILSPYSLPPNGRALDAPRDKC